MLRDFSQKKWGWGVNIFYCFFALRVGWDGGGAYQWNQSCDLRPIRCLKKTASNGADRQTDIQTDKQTDTHTDVATLWFSENTKLRSKSVEGLLSTGLSCLVLVNLLHFCNKPSPMRRNKWPKLFIYINSVEHKDKTQPSRQSVKPVFLACDPLSLRFSESKPQYS